MGRWSRVSGKKEFKVKVHYMKHGTARVTLPKPLVEMLYKPDEIIFKISEDNRIIICIE